MIAELLTAFTEAQECVLTLLGAGLGDCLRPELDGALEDLAAAGLVTFKCPLTPALTCAGWAAFERLDSQAGS